MGLLNKRMRSPLAACRRGSMIVLASAAGSGLAACGATMSELMTSSTVANYQPASLFSPSGYSLSNNADGSLRVMASGPPATPADRLEKIALARAAEYGAEQHLKSFKATPAHVTVTCGKSEYFVKGERNKVKPLDYRVVSIDVTYGTDILDPAARSTNETAETLKAQLASETIPPDVQAQAAQDVARQCGR